MKIFCLATIENPEQRETLVLSLRALKVIPFIQHDDISVDYEGAEDKCELIIKLFEHYHRHTIYSEKTP